MKPLSKSELLLQMKRFVADKDRGISVALFCDLAGMSVVHFREVFLDEKHPLTETVQKRVNKAYIHWKMGMVKVMKRNDNTRYVDYRREETFSGSSVMQPERVTNPAIRTSI